MVRSRLFRHRSRRPGPWSFPRRVVNRSVYVAASVLLLAWGCRSSAPPEEETRATESVAELFQQRQQLDETVWQDEVLAQRYEDYFVQLWDDLRAAEDKFDVLANASFESLEWGEPQLDRQHDWGIHVRTLDGPPRQLDSTEWADQLRVFAADGFRIIQTEWHHARFEPGEAEPPRSTVAVRIDAVNESRQTRLTLTGDIQVRWERPSEPDGPPVPKVIDARGIRITQRKGPTAFEPALSISPQEIGPIEHIPSIIVYDLDGDGLSELLIPSTNLLYRNRGDWKFERTNLLAGPPLVPIMASLAADFNGNGRVDLLCATANTLMLYRADEQGQYNIPGRVVEVVQGGLANPSVLTAGDIDADGDLDVWLAQYKPTYWMGQMPTPYYDANDAFPSFLLINDGQGRFEEATEARGLAEKRFRRTYSASFADLDDDGDLDLAVASDFAGLDLYTNDGTGHFQDVTRSLGDERHCFGMSLTFADYNRDQRMDLYMTGMASTTARRLEQLGLGRDEFAEHQQKRGLMGYGNRMFLAQGDGWRQAAFNDQVARTGWTWGSTSFDFDNDADADIYVANGHRSYRTAKDYCTRFWCHDIYTGDSQHDPVMLQFFQQVYQDEFLPISWNGFEHNCLMMNRSGGGFMKVGFLMGVAFEFDSRNVISDDFDGDGRRDLLVVGKSAEEAGASIHLLRNVWESDHHWIGVRLRETGQGRSPLGATVHVAYNGGSQIASIVSGDSLYSQHAPVVHFGLGDVDELRRLEVRWPDGHQIEFPHPQVDQYHQIAE